MSENKELKVPKLKGVEKLSYIQRNIKCIKDNYNAYGKYNFRTVEDILEKLKPFLDGDTLVIDDDIVFEVGRWYIKSTAIYKNGDFEMRVKSFAREDEDKKGMDASQVTVKTSSYARKAALCGMLLISNDSDGDKDAFVYSQQRDFYVRHRPEVELAVDCINAVRGGFDEVMAKTDSVSSGMVGDALQVILTEGFSKAIKVSKSASELKIIAEKIRMSLDDNFSQYLRQDYDKANKRLSKPSFEFTKPEELMSDKEQETLATISQFFFDKYGIKFDQPTLIKSIKAKFGQLPTTKVAIGKITKSLTENEVCKD